MSKSSVLSVADVVEVLAAMRTPLTPRQIRHATVQPSFRCEGRTGGRLYTVDDVALLVVYAGLHEQACRAGLPAWTARAAVRFLGDSIRGAMTRRQPGWVVLDPIQGTVAVSATRGQSVVGIELAGVVRRTAVAVATLRQSAPDVWTGRAFVARDQAAAFT